MSYPYWKYTLAAGSTAAAITGLFTISKHLPPMSTSADWAAWVQAVGSIAAIVATAGTGVWLQHRDRSYAAEERLRERRDAIRDMQLRQFLVIQSCLEETRVLLAQLTRVPDRSTRILQKLEIVHATMRSAPLAEFGDINCVRLAQMAIDYHGRLIEGAEATVAKEEDIYPFYRAAKSRIEAFRRSITTVKSHLSEGSEVPETVRLYAAISNDVRTEWGV